jgi:hypothetical protein
MSLLMCMHGWHLFVCEWMRLMCMDEIIVYDYIYICVCVCIHVIFQFKTGVKLK